MWILLRFKKGYYEMMLDAWMWGISLSGDCMFSVDFNGQFE